MTPRQYAKTIDGWMTRREQNLLYQTARHIKGRGVIVEIGSWKGKSTVCLAAGSSDGAKTIVYAIDPHTGSPEHHQKLGKNVWTFDALKENLQRAGVASIVKPLVMTSREAIKFVQEPIELLFIDGNHSYEEVRRDFELWSPKLIDGGLILFHDTINWPGVKRLVKEKIYTPKEFHKVRLIDSIVIATKGAGRTRKEALRITISRLGLDIFSFGVWINHKFLRRNHPA